MSRLINYGPGEICDRLSILALKILFANGRETDHWRKERAVLLTQLRGRGEGSPWYEYAVELGAVNSAIWHKEDALREQRRLGRPAEAELTELRVDLAFALQELNDRRSELIAKINELAGEKTGPEKVNG